MTAVTARERPYYTVTTRRGATTGWWYGNGLWHLHSTRALCGTPGRVSSSCCHHRHPQSALGKTHSAPSLYGQLNGKRSHRPPSKTPLSWLWGRGGGGGLAFGGPADQARSCASRGRAGSPLYTQTVSPGPDWRWRPHSGPARQRFCPENFHAEINAHRILPTGRSLALDNRRR